MLLVKEPFRKKGAILWEAIQDCLSLCEDQPVSQSEDAEAGKSGVVQEGREVQGGVLHFMAMVGMEVRVGKKWKAMLDEPGPETADTQEDEPAPETDETQQKPKMSKVLKLKPVKTGRIIK